MNRTEPLARSLSALRQPHSSLHSRTSCSALHLWLDFRLRSVSIQVCEGATQVNKHVVTGTRTETRPTVWSHIHTRGPFPICLSNEVKCLQTVGGSWRARAE